MSIEDLQKDFIEAIFGGDKAPAAKHVIGDDTLTAEQRFGIYKGSVHGILSQALGLTFPVCKALVGDEFFNRMCDCFIDEYPPTTSFFAEYGSNLPTFLNSFEPVKDLPYLADVARLEWARQHVWHQQNDETGDFSQLAELTEEQQSQVKFCLTKTLRLIKSNYRIDDIWFAHQDDDTIDLASIDIYQTVKLFVFKDDDIVKISLMNHTLDDSHFWDFIHAIDSGANLEKLAENFGESLPNLLNQAIQSGWIESFEISNNN